MIILLTIIVVLNILLASQAFGESNAAPPSLSSEAAIIIDSKTGKVLYEKNANKQMYPASLTKMATAIYAIETGNLDEVVIVSSRARNTDGSSVYLEEGEQVTLKKLVQGLLINSGNDSGVAIAEHLSGNVERFSFEINEYLKEVVGVQNTNFNNPHGLFDPEHVTTAEDLAKIIQYAIKNDIFREVFGTVDLKWKGESWDTTLLTHHKLMREIPYEGITGGKTGFVSQSGFTLATTAKRGNLSLIVITLNSNKSSDAYNDTIHLLDYGFENYRRSSISKGTKFMVDEQEYKTPTNLDYTYPMDEKVDKEIKNGRLEIKMQDGTVIASILLDKIKKEDKVIHMIEVTKDIKASSVDEEHFPILVVLVAALILGLFVLFYRQIRKV